MTGSIRTIRNGIRFEYEPGYEMWKVLGFMHKVTRKHTQRGTRILYPDGTKRFISNSWYNDINIENL